MLTPDQKFTAMRGDVELTAEVSPCCFMYGSGLQITVYLPDRGRTYVLKKEIPIKDATEEDCHALLETVGVVPCKNCQKPAFDPATCGTTRDGECETCFLDKAMAKFNKSEKDFQEKLVKDDAKHKAKGFTHRVMAWVHPASGDDYQMIIWMVNPSDADIVAQLKKKKSTVTNDYKLIVL
ncbi:MULTISPECIES: hypothetical protein [Pseudomonas]|uniref:hypothetical protein n=1 Tax=Pseudomonas TaxID=286 RepID=UPI000712D77D|nr:MULTISPECIES: hypothetical protein [Pseudomonas]KRP87418.1 hypothetical protein TX25_25990 [Pseudomonas lactis]